MVFVTYSQVIFVTLIVGWFAVSKLFGHKLPEKDGWVNEFVRQFFTMPNFFWGTLCIVMGVGFILQWFFGPDFSSTSIEWYYRCFTVVACALMGPAIGREQKTKKKKKKRRIIKTL